MRIRGGAGLGDAIYVRVIAEHFVKQGNSPVIVCSDYPGAFEGSGAITLPFDRFNIDVLAHYTVGKRDASTNQWQDICRSAGIAEIPLRFSWKPKNNQLLDRIRAEAGSRPIVLVHGGRVPMARTDGFGKELLPKREAFELVLAQLKNCFTVRFGKGADLYPLEVGVDLNGATSVTDLFDLASICDGVVGQCSLAIPLAEAFDRPLLIVWAAHGMQYNMHPYIRQITPQKILSKPTSKFVVDDWAKEKIIEIVCAFNQFRMKAAA